jgi:large subunit ribosomal protein L25
MQANKITATTRTETGKGANRRLRAAGKLPAVSYGAGSDTRALVVDPDVVSSILNSDLGVNSVVELEVDGKATTAMIGDYQYHPLSRRLLHADFVEVKADQMVEVKVPLRLTGKAKGIVMGGKLRTVFRELPIRCIPAKIPSEIVHDITELDLDQTLSVNELTVPEGVEVLLSEKRTVAVIATDKRAKGEEEEATATATATAAAKPEGEEAK